MEYLFPWVIFNMINNISDQASSFPGTQLNQSDNFLDSLREFFAILNSSRKGVYMGHHLLASDISNKC